MTPLEAIRELAEHDHSILKGDHARNIARVFGLESISTGRIQDQHEQIKGSDWNVAFNRAGWLAQHRCRRRLKQISISLRLVGTIKKEIARLEPKDDLR